MIRHNMLYAKRILDMTNKYITIDGFEQLSRQQLFDMSAAHILKTGVQSRLRSRRCCAPDDVTVCSYSGTGCAAAPFLKEEFREKADRAGSWSRLHRGGIGNVPLHETLFVSKLQICHDRYECDSERDFMTHWHHAMKQLAEEYQLDASILN